MCVFCVSQSDVSSSEVLEERETVHTKMLIKCSVADKDT